MIKVASSCNSRVGSFIFNILEGLSEIKEIALFKLINFL